MGKMRGEKDYKLRQLWSQWKQTGNELFLREFIESTYPQLYRWAGRFFKCGQTRDDVVQAVIMRLFEQRRFGEGDILAWLYVVLRRICLDRLNSAWFRKAKFIDITATSAGQSPAPDTRLERLEFDEMLWHAISQLEETDRELVIARLMHDKTLREVASQFRKSTATIHRHLPLAMSRLRGLLVAEVARRNRCSHPKAEQLIFEYISDNDLD